jgi:hypothetical protein
MLAMRARGFALRDAFPDVLKGLITAEEAQDYPAEDKPRQARDITPANPLDALAPAAPALPVSKLVLMEEAMADTVEPDLVEVVALEPQITDAVTVQPEPPAEAIGFALRVPGKDAAYSVHQTIEQWADAYEDLAEKTCRAAKVPARDRMTKLRELKESNDEMLKRVDAPKKVRHIAAYQQRLRSLGAAV